jgi:hypothetical protein
MSNFNIQQHASADFTVSADATMPVLTASGTIHIDNVEAVFQASIATHATDFGAFSLTNVGTAGSGTTVVAGPNNFDVATNGGVAITALVPSTLAVVAAAKELTDGEVLAFYWNEATTDVASATVHVDVRYTQVTTPA